MLTSYLIAVGTSVVVVDLTSQVINIGFYSECEKSVKFRSEALILA